MLLETTVARTVNDPRRKWLRVLLTALTLGAPVAEADPARELNDGIALLGEGAYAKALARF